MNKIKQSILVSIIIGAGLSFSACGGGSGSGGSDEPLVFTGTFIDAPVNGLSYKTQTLEGNTSDGGKFSFIEGESIGFKLGAVDLGGHKANKVLTPVELSYAKPESNAVLNRVRYLMSLDDNDDMSDGITISSDIAKTAQNWSTPDFTLNEADFETRVSVDLATVSRTLKSTQEAKEHFDTTVKSIYSGTYMGTWEATETNPIDGKEITALGDMNMTIKSDGSITSEGTSIYSISTGVGSVDFNTLQISVDTVTKITFIELPDINASYNGRYLNPNHIIGDMLNTDGVKVGFYTVEKL